MKSKKEKGITLIALIITIIVMLILVAVTVNVAINGGLFGKANDAAKDTEREAIYDQIVSAMVLADNGKINVTETANAAIADLQAKNYTVTSEGTTEVILTVTGKKETYEYTITDEKIIIGQEENEGIKDKLTGNIEIKDGLMAAKATVNSNPDMSKYNSETYICLNAYSDEFEDLSVIAEGGSSNSPVIYLSITTTNDEDYVAFYSTEKQTFDDGDGYFAVLDEGWNIFSYEGRQLKDAELELTFTNLSFYKLADKDLKDEFEKFEVSTFDDYLEALNNYFGTVFVYN